MRFLFSVIWQRWLYHEFTGKQCRVVKVVGWNRCVYDTPTGDRVRAEFMGMPWAKR